MAQGHERTLQYEVSLNLLPTQHFLNSLQNFGDWIQNQFRNGSPAICERAQISTQCRVQRLRSSYRSHRSHSEDPLVPRMQILNLYHNHKLFWKKWSNYSFPWVSQLDNGSRRLLFWLRVFANIEQKFASVKCHILRKPTLSAKSLRSYVVLLRRAVCRL